MIMKFGAALGLAALLTATTAAAAPGDADPLGHRLGAVAAMRFRLPLGPAHDDGRLGLSFNLQHRYVAGDGHIERYDGEALEIALRPSGLALLAGGTEVGQLGERLRADDDGKGGSPWRTVGLVLGGAALVGGIYFLHLVNEAEKNSD